MTDRQKWIDESVRNVLQSLLKHVKDFDSATLTWDMMSDQMRSDIHHALTAVFDTGLACGIADTDEAREEDDEMQLELDLDDLRRIGEEEDDEDPN